MSTTGASILPVLIAFGLGCSSAPASRNARAPQGEVVGGVYQLMAIGGRVPQYWSRQGGGCDVPVFSAYTFDEHGWVSLDTIRAIGDCRVGLPPDDSVATRGASGFYRIVGDTINLYVRDTMMGPKGWVMRFFVRGDTLVHRAGEFDPGDYVYVLQRRR